MNGIEYRLKNKDEEERIKNNKSIENQVNKTENEKKNINNTFENLNVYKLFTNQYKMELHKAGIFYFFINIFIFLIPRNFFFFFNQLQENEIMKYKIKTQDEE